jgi:hypothetical protein
MITEPFALTASLGSCPVRRHGQCHFCGAQMQRSGSCMVCTSCGETSGCS